MTDSNRRPSRCKRDALPAELIARSLPTRTRLARFFSRSSEAGKHGPRGRGPSALVEFVAKPLSGFELGLLRGGNLDLFAGARITAFRGGAAGNREGAEPDETDLRAPLQRTGDRFEHRFDRLAGRGFRQVSLSGNGIDELVSIHVLPPKRDAGWLHNNLRRRV